MTAVKICGVTTPEMVRHAAECGADWVGFVLVPASPRNVLGDEGPGRFDLFADLVSAARDADVKSVALVVDADARTLIALAGAQQPDVFQFHGEETPDFIEAFAGDLAPPIEVWKALAVSTPADLERAGDYEAADRLLLDARPPKGAARTGGHGAAFDWSLLEGWRAPKPWLLAGGLNPENVAGAVERTRAPAVDVSSGVETAPGVKDASRIAEFIRAAKGPRNNG